MGSRGRRPPGPTPSLPRRQAGAPLRGRRPPRPAVWRLSGLASTPGRPMETKKMPRRRVNVEVGDSFDNWSAQSSLGRGGSSMVWMASHPERGQAALKVLKEPSRYNLQRFSDEAKALRAIGDHPGVLPLVATNALTTPTPRKAWLATRVAEEVRVALGADVDLSTVVGVGRGCAETFADLVRARRFITGTSSPRTYFGLATRGSLATSASSTTPGRSTSRRRTAG